MEFHNCVQSLQNMLKEHYKFDKYLYYNTCDELDKFYYYLKQSEYQSEFTFARINYKKDLNRIIKELLSMDILYTYYVLYLAIKYNDEETIHMLHKNEYFTYLNTINNLPKEIFENFKYNDDPLKMAIKLNASNETYNCLLLYYSEE